jgi:hypothetical protein
MISMPGACGGKMKGASARVEFAAAQSPALRDGSAFTAARVAEKVAGVRVEGA